MGARASAPLRRRRGSEAPSAEGPLELAIISDPGEDLCGNQPVCRAGDGVAALVPSSGEEPASRRAPLSRRRVDGAVESTRRFSTNAPYVEF